MPRSAEEPGAVIFEQAQCLSPMIRALGWRSVIQAQPQTLGPHRHQGCWEICYIVRGRVDWWADREKCRVPGKHLYFTWPGEPHGGMDSTLHPCELYWLILPPPPNPSPIPPTPPTPGLLPASGRTAKVDLSLAQAMNAMQARMFPASSTIADCFARLIREHQQPRLMAQGVVEALLTQLLIQVIRDHDRFANEQKPQRTPDDPLVAQAIARIEADLVRSPTLDELARSLNVSTSLLRDRFVLKTGLTPADYLSIRRLDRAAELLKDTRLTVTQVAFTVGFSSSQYFATAFKHRTSLSPLAYRRQYA